MSKENTSYIDDVMGFDPSSMDAFNEPAKTDYDQNIYKTRPADSKSEDGHYHSTVKIIYNPFDFRKSVIEQVSYWMEDSDGGFIARSKLANNDKTCPIFTTWKKLWFSKDETKKEWAREMFQRSQSRYALVQVMEDENFPEKVGKIFAMKLPKAIWERMTEKMHPTNGKTPQKLMDYLIGPVLTMNVVPGPADDPKRTSYNLCDFETDPTPITLIDGTPMFSDEEVELIEAYDRALKDSLKAKTDAKKEAAKKMIDDLSPKIRPLYQKAVDYLKENAFDLEKEVGYQPWDEATTGRVNAWLDTVLQMKDPKEGSSAGGPTGAPDSSDMFEDMMTAPSTAPDIPVSDNEIGEDLPF